MNSVFSQSEKGKCKLRKYYWQFTLQGKAKIPVIYRVLGIIIEVIFIP